MCTYSKRLVVQVQEFGSKFVFTITAVIPLITTAVAGLIQEEKVSNTKATLPKAAGTYHVVCVCVCVCESVCVCVCAIPEEKVSNIKANLPEGRR
jgi:hypothetical protein